MTTAAIIAAVLFPLSLAWCATAWAGVQFGRIANESEMLDRSLTARREEEERLRKDRAEEQRQRRVN